MEQRAGRVPRPPLPPHEHDATGFGLTHAELVDALRSADGLVDVGDHEHPNLQLRGRPFLHFHESDDGTYADVRFGGGDFEPVWASTPTERLVLLARVLDHVEQLARTRKSNRKRSRR